MMLAPGVATRLYWCGMHDDVDTCIVNMAFFTLLSIGRLASCAGVNPVLHWVYSALSMQSLALVLP